MTPDELLAWRRRLGVTQREAAALLRTPVSSYRKWEQGQKHCSCPGLLHIATQAALAGAELRALVK